MLWRLKDLVWFVGRSYICDEKIWDETLMDNVQCCQLPKAENDKSLVIDGGWWQVLWVFCFYIALFFCMLWTS